MANVPIAGRDRKDLIKISAINQVNEVLGFKKNETAFCSGSGTRTRDLTIMSRAL